MDFDPAAALALLCQPLNETRNPHAKAIALYQFQTWVYCPTDPAIVKQAGQMIAAKASHEYRSFIKDNLDDYPEEEESSFVDESVFKNHLDGELGLLSLLYCPSPDGLRTRIDSSFKEALTARDAFEFMARQAIHVPGTRISAKRAFTFRKMQIEDDPEARYVATERGNSSPKTMHDRWKGLRDSIPFIFLSGHFDIELRPERIPDPVVPGFIYGRLTDQAQDMETFRELAGAYAYLKKIFSEAKSDLRFLSVPDSITEIEIPIPDFSTTERQTFDRYDEDPDYINDR